ncbi:hypothetical protein Clacol_005326 [Clathrus columnatus]|uniref:Nitronate monooxygenase domain-containing protein n=1 Tax=Clathrus columnatus TaxID=1419009 RepID=A0AAV5AGM6_9AGAM|nr:hypothetical protein Clacol_005326 [Clathrus columnatus]
MLPVWTKLTKLLDVRTPVVLAPMGAVSNGELAIRVSQGGGYGFIGTDLNDPISFSKELDTARSRLGVVGPDAPLPLGVGYLGWLLDKGNRTQQLLNIALEKRVQSVWLSFGSNLGKWVEYVRQYDSQRTIEHKTLIWIVANSLEVASRAINEWKADVLVLQGCEAGGHGHSEALPLISLLGLVKSKFSNGPPLVAAGGIVNGAQIAGLLLMGADGTVMGTRFAATVESSYSPNQKRGLVEATKSIRTLVFDTINGPTQWPDGINARALRNKAIFDVEAGVDFEERKRLYHEAVKNDDTSRIAIWAGSSVGLVNDIPSTLNKNKDLVNQVHQELIDSLRDASGFLG